MTFDVIIVGSGLSGLSCAIKLAEEKKHVVLISKTKLAQSNSFYAQGGIAAVLDLDDSIDNHINDTLNAGAGLCDITNVTEILSSSQKVINWLINQGVEFTKDRTSNTGYHLNQEGGHNYRRIFHYKDITGQEIINKLLKKLKNYPNITILEDHFAIDLIINNDKCVGINLLSIVDNNITTLIADNIILSTGGVGQAYLHTTNPIIATGDGIAMAFNAGANISNMEFIQFHPTSLYNPHHHNTFLISEALRGEGAILYNHNKYRFMQKYDSRMEMAPRDIVTRAINSEIKKNNIDFVYLDITHKSKSFLINHFPKIYSHCLSIGIDISKEPIPVVPAAHYSCGGIQTNINGQTTISNLFAVGECANSGLNGANRLASNSLLECVAMSDRTTSLILSKEHLKMTTKPIKYSYIKKPLNKSYSTIKNELKTIMSNNVGVIRTNKSLNFALEQIKILKDKLPQLTISVELLELKNLLTVSQIITNCAILRKESRGIHYSLNYPFLNSTPHNTILKNNQYHY